MDGMTLKSSFFLLDNQERKFYNKYRTKYLVELARNLHIKE